MTDTILSSPRSFNGFGRIRTDGDAIPNGRHFVSAALQAAIRRLPAHAQEIQYLIKRDEEFRGICDDLVAAENALKHVNRLPKELRKERYHEYESLIESLTAEVETALRRAKVVPLPGTKLQF